MDRADLLLEIGSEEIPAGYLERAGARLQKNLRALFDSNGIQYDADGIRVFTTPRRIAILMPELAAQQPTRKQLRLGPAVAAAFDAAGEATPAALGFARSVGAEVGQLGRFDGDKGERLGLEVETGGTRTVDLLLADGRLRELLQLGFPKTMRWIPGDDLAYARPIRWLVCLFGEEIVPLQLAHLRAGRLSRGHRTLAPGEVEIDRAADYEATLERAQVVVDPQRRRAIIDEAAHRLAKEAGGRLHEDAGLLAEVVHLVEHPTPLRGSFDRAIAELLPREVIITAMRSHQRYFSVENDRDGLQPVFLTFRDGGDKGLQNVGEGNERVLRARLDDAVFYWNEDRSATSEEKLERLDAIVWMEGYGSMGDKSRRTRALALELARSLDPTVDEEQLGRAALLCKSDLATEMIKDGKEFTKLQGVMGRYYALEAGEPTEVADAIREHLHPRFADDRLPEGDLGTLVALADRFDSLAGCVLAGFAPTGSQDPYALRRQALAVLRILIDCEWSLDLETIVRHALDRYEAGDAERASAAAAIVDLFWGRLETLLSDLPAEIVRAVLSVFPLDPLENARAARALASLRGQESFAMLLEGAKRCRNILVKASRLPEEELDPHARAHRLQNEARRRWSEGQIGSFAAADFQEDAEKQLVTACGAAVPDLDAAIQGGDYVGAYRALAELGPHIDRYFTDVLVNAKDPSIRSRRLDWLEAVHYLFTRFADLSRVPPA